VYAAKNPADFKAQFFSNALAARPTYVARGHLWHELNHRYLEAFGFASTSPGLSRIRIVIVVAYAAGLIAALSISESGASLVSHAAANASNMHRGASVFDTSTGGIYLIYGITPMCVGSRVRHKLCPCMVPRWCGCRSRRICSSSKPPLRVYRFRSGIHPGSLPTTVAFLKRHVPQSMIVMVAQSLVSNSGSPKACGRPNARILYQAAPRLYRRRRAGLRAIFCAFHNNEPAVAKYVDRLLATSILRFYANPSYRIYANSASRI